MLSMKRHLRSLGHLLMIWLGIVVALLTAAIVLAAIDPLRF
jgi:hypothetical protein